MSRSKGHFSKKQQGVSLTSESINIQIEAFLSKGGRINNIERGVSAVDASRGQRQITLSPPSKKS